MPTVAFTLATANVFPAGTAVKVFPLSAFLPGTDYSAAMPSVSPTAEGTMGSSSVTVSGLAEGSWYCACAMVSGRMVSVRFLTDMADEDEGPRGIQGIQGERGESGDAGATGAKGEAGAKGDSGSAGATGSPGEQGARGETGAKGTTGTTGPQGIQGEAGATGAKGSAGATGSPGETGATGAAGASFAVGVPSTSGLTSITAGTAFRLSVSVPYGLKVLATLSGILGAGVVRVLTCATEGGSYLEVGKMGLVLATGVEVAENDSFVLVRAGYWVKVTVSGVSAGNVALSGVGWEL